MLNLNACRFLWSLTIADINKITKTERARIVRWGSFMFSKKKLRCTAVILLENELLIGNQHVWSSKSEKVIGLGKS